MTEETPKTGCVCPLSGFCNRHGIDKTPHMHKLCQNHTGYFNAWEACRGPGQQNTNCGKSEPTQVTQTLQTNKISEIEFPSLIQQAKNLAKASTEHILNGAKNVSAEKQQERLSICHGCRFYDSPSNGCKACGCNLGVKTKWKTSKCPKGYW